MSRGKDGAAAMIVGTEEYEMGKEKKSKKPNGYAILAVIMALLAGVTFTGSVALAKYVVSEMVGSRSAKVLQWGFTVEVNAEDLFGDAYRSAAKVSHDDEGVSVKANTGNMNIVAPGTSGHMTFAIDGTAEVYSKLTIASPGASQEVFLAQDNGAEGKIFYYPLKWTLKKDGAPLVADGTLGEVFAKLDTYRKEAIKPGERPKGAGSYAIEWRWDYFVDEEISKKDTMIGQIANGATIENYTASTVVSFNLEIRIEQIRFPVQDGQTEGQNN